MSALESMLWNLDVAIRDQAMAMPYSGYLLGLAGVFMLALFIGDALRRNDPRRLAGGV